MLPLGDEQRAVARMRVGAREACAAAAAAAAATRRPPAAWRGGVRRARAPSPPPSAPVLATVLRGRPVLTHVVLPGRGQLRARSASAPRPRRVIARVDFAVPRPPVLAVRVLGARSTRDAHGPAARAVRQRVSAPPEWHAVTLYPSGVSS